MAIPSSIDRFQIVRELGRGSQGVVYLATDPHLERQVAIKTLRTHLSMQSERRTRLMREARNVSKLQHPNIIPLYEAGEYEGLLYLVFEYVDGVSLRDQIKKNGPFVVHRAITMMSQILAGIASAHQERVVHRDLSPSNILIDKHEMPRIMDFGISVIVSDNKNSEKDISGTPCYMSPEHFSKSPIGPKSDIFSLGLIFYELIVGRPAIEAENHIALMYKIANEPVMPPSLKNRTVDKKLDGIILKAVEKSLDLRYADALEMKKDLDDYLDDTGNRETEQPAQSQTHSTLEFLLRRMRQKSDFPTFSQHIAEINKKASVSRGNYASASDLANTVLKDYSLTNKLLRLVNSAFYGQFAGSVTTVSRAVVVLGFEQVKAAASSLMLFEHLKDKSQSMELKDTAISSFMSGMIAKDLANRVGMQETEEAFICSMLHNLGRHLTIFYFPEESRQINNLMAQKGIDERAATRSVLGVSYEDLGIGVAKTWKFPDKIVASLRSLPKGKAEKPKSEVDMLRNLASFSNELCHITSSPEDEEREKAMEALLKRFEGSFPDIKKQISKLLNSAKEKVEKYSGTLNINLKKSRFMSRVEVYSRSQEEDITAVKDIDSKSEQKAHEEDMYDSENLEIRESALIADTPTDFQALLINGIQDITNTLVGEYELNDVLTMVLETMYRGFGLNCALLFIMEANRNKMQARFGFGKNIKAAINNFSFEISKSRDVFSLSITQGKDISIVNTNDLIIKKRIPEWFYRLASAQAFVLFPVSIDKTPFALFYMDRAQTGSVIDEKHLNYVRTLRNQAVLAIKQKR